MGFGGAARRGVLADSGFEKGEISIRGDE